MKTKISIHLLLIAVMATYNYQVIGQTPCPGVPTVTYEGQVYNTVMIGEQCWFKENLNVGIRIDASQYESNNNIIEKWCYDDLESNCNIYGGLYWWDEIMNYSSIQGVQGICPPGWHIPTDNDWCILTLFIDPTVDCSTGGESGTDAGGKMKEAGTAHWSYPNTGATKHGHGHVTCSTICPQLTDTMV